MHELDRLLDECEVCVTRGWVSFLSDLSHVIGALRRTNVVPEIDAGFEGTASGSDLETGRDQAHLESSWTFMSPITLPRTSMYWSAKFAS